MKKFLKKLTSSVIPVVLLGLIAVACDKDIQDLEPMRMFTPAGAIKSISSVDQVKLAWNPSLYTTQSSGVTYTVEVAADTLFATPILLSVQTDTSGVVLTDDQLEVRKNYYARIKANSLGERPESKWVVSNRFRIRGEQIALPTYGPEIKATSVVLRWIPTQGITRIVLTPLQGTPVEVTVTPEAAAEGKMLVTGLQPNTTYNFEIYAGNKSKGFGKITTKGVVSYTVTLEPGADLGAALAASANGDIIALQPGEYNLTSTVLIQGKYVTVVSVSGNPADTRINFKQFDVRDNGGGLKFSGLDLNGGGSDYFFNLVGGAADLRNFIVENSIVRNVKHSFMRGNRANNNDFKADTIKISNSLIFDVASSGSYSFLMIDEMEFISLELTNSTFRNVGRQLISWASNLTMSQTPVILINQSTINNFGFRDYPLLDTRDNTVKFTVRNSILANIPTSGTIGENLVRAGGSSELLIANNNFFNLTNGSGAPLVFPANATERNNLEVDLGWGAATTDFSLPANSPVRSASTSGGPLGDLRWIY